jgi:hypothetical protein
MDYVQLEYILFQVYEVSRKYISLNLVFIKEHLRQCVAWGKYLMNERMDQ